MVKTEKEIWEKIGELEEEIAKLRGLLENKFTYEDNERKEQYFVKLHPEELVITKHITFLNCEETQDISIHRSVLKRIFDWLKELEAI